MIKDTTRAQFGKVAQMLDKYTWEHVAGMSRAEFEAHQTATETLSYCREMHDTSKTVEKIEEVMFAEPTDSKEYLGNTALDEYETAKLWRKSEPRYWVYLIVDGFQRSQDIQAYLFRETGSMPDDEVAQLVVLGPDRTLQDYTESGQMRAIEQTFTKAEVRQLHVYLTRCPMVRRVIVRRARPPSNRSPRYGAPYIVRGEYILGFLPEKGELFPFDVEGYFHLIPRWERRRQKQDQL